MKRSAASTHRLGTLATNLTVLWLVVFHAILLCRRVADSTITEPGVLARWIGSALLLLAALRLRALAAGLAGRPLYSVFWLLVALLHLVVPAGQSMEVEAPLQTLLQYAVAAAPAVAWAVARLGSGSTLARLAAAIRDSASQTFAPAGLAVPAGSRAPPLL